MVKKILLIILMSLFFNFELMGNEEDIKEVIIENKIKIEDELKLYIPNEQRKIIWKLIKRPVFSKIDINLEGKKVEFVPDIAGEYEIKLALDGLKKNKIIYVFKETKEEEIEIQKSIEESYKNKNILKLEINIEKVKKNYPNSIHLVENFYKIINLARELKNSEIEIKYLTYIDNEYKMLPETREMILERLYKLNKNEEYLRKIAENNEVYSLELIKLNLQKSQNKEEEIEKILEKYSTKLNLKLAEFIGDYYNEMGNTKKAIGYYKVSNEFKLAKLYIKNDKEEELNEMLEKLNLAEKLKLKIEEIKAKKEKLKVENNYYKKATESLANNKFNISKLYYSQIIKKSTDRELVKKAYYNLSKAYLLTNEYQKSKEYIEEYIVEYADIKDVKAYYDLALINYNLGKFDEAEEEFNRILKLYPYTIWETKAKIYMLKIKKMRGDLS